MTDAGEQRDYLHIVMKRTGWSQTELASRAGLDPSTLSRFLSGTRQGHSLRASTIRKIEDVSGIVSGNPAAADSAELDKQVGFGEPEAVLLQVDKLSPMARVILGLSDGRHNIDAWTLRSRALESAGFRPGDVLLVAIGETPLAGDVVCAQLYDWVTGRAETVFRIFQPPFLVAASVDTQLMRPNVVDGDKVQIKGVVLSSIRGRTTT